MSTSRRPFATPTSPATPRNRTLSTPRGGTPKSSIPTTTSSPRTRTTSTRGTSLAPPGHTKASGARTKSPARSTTRPASPPPVPKTPVSIREAIALKRAEAKKAQQGPKNSRTVDDTPVQHEVDDEVEVGRWSIQDSIERARSSGNLNLSSRSLTSIPAALFEVHLGVAPEPLKIAPQESAEQLEAGKTIKRAQTAWFEAVDLAVLKLRDNAIVELHPEISLFGSLKTLDLHNNRLTALPTTLGELVNLVVLDLSSNQLTSLPEDLSSFPLLTTLNVSSNQLSTLPLNVPRLSTSQGSAASFFELPKIERASKPLPSLRQLLASDNNLVAKKIPVDNLPENLIKCDLGKNPLGDAKALVHALSQLRKLKELFMESAEITDTSFTSVKGFTALETLDLGKTDVTAKVGEVFQGRSISWEGEETDGGVHIILGNRIKKEAWEIEAERRARGRVPAPQQSPAASSKAGKEPPISQQAKEPLKESWELDAEQGLLTEGGRRRARAAAAATQTSSGSSEATSPKESIPVTFQDGPNVPNLTQYYDSTHATLTLPRSSPRTHNRARSLALTRSVGEAIDPTVPTPTLPFPIILAQSFSQSLRSLILTGRRLDTSFVLPTVISDTDTLLPTLEELRLDGCALGDSVSVTRDDSSDSPRKEPIFNIIASLFPMLTSLDLSDNKLTSLPGVRALLIPDPARKTKGLKVLRVQGNKLSDLTGLEAVAQVLKSEGTVEGWRLEELDLRDNEIAKLPPMLGHLPLDVLLVEGNTFRVPARRVWERDGTKGLLTWLKDRVE